MKQLDILTSIGKTLQEQSKFPANVMTLHLAISLSIKSTVMEDVVRSVTPVSGSHYFSSFARKVN